MHLYRGGLRLRVVEFLLDRCLAASCFLALHEPCSYLFCRKSSSVRPCWGVPHCTGWQALADVDGGNKGLGHRVTEFQHEVRRASHWQDSEGLNPKPFTLPPSLHMSRGSHTALSPTP